MAGPKGVVTLLSLLVLLFSVHNTSGFKVTPVQQCSFQESMCHWSNSNKAALDWSRHRGLTPTRQGGKILTGPLYDHTMGNNTGYYLYMETSTAKSGQLADLISAINTDLEGARLTFWYYMHGQSMGKLAVIVWPFSAPYPDRGAQLAWITSGDEGDKWRFISLDVPKQTMYYKIIIRAEVGGSGTSDIAIDDVTIAPIPDSTTPKPTTTPIPGSVLTLSRCTFQENLCIWKNAPSGKVAWSRIKGKTPTRKGGSILTGPATDHSLQSDQGYYVYMETSAHMPGDTADLVSPALSKPVKMSFWYYMHGLTMGNLSVQLLTTGGLQDQTLWTIQGDKGDNWLKAYVDVPENQTGSYKLLFRAVEGGAGTSDVAIDDVTITQSVDPNSTAIVPAMTSLPPAPDGGLTQGPHGRNTSWTGILYQCNFDNGLPSDWTRPDAELMPWRFRSDHTPTTGTGANRDHTSGTGQFAYIETSVQGGKVLNEQTSAVLTTPEQAVTLECPVLLTFWYNMYGKTIGTLKVLLHDNTAQPLWSRQHQQCQDGDTWKKAEVPIPHRQLGKSFKIDFVASRGTSIYGDISIDDVTITQTCTDTGDVPAGAGQDQVVFYCDFEYACNFNQPRTDDFDWSLNSGSTFTMDTGPSFDRTKGDKSGHYMYIETSSFARGVISPSNNPGDSAILESPVLAKPAQGCRYRLVFFYNMYGKDTGSLSVKMKGATYNLWSKSGQQNKDGTEWSEASVYLDVGRYTQFELVGIRGNGYYGDIGIDDVSVELTCSGKTRTTMETSTSSTSTPSTTPSTTTSTDTTSTTASTTTTPTTATTTTPTTASTTTTPTTATTTTTPTTATTTTPTTASTTTPTTATTTTTPTTASTTSTTASTTTTPTTATTTTPTTASTTTTPTTATTTTTPTTPTTATTTPTTASTSTTTPTTASTTPTTASTTPTTASTTPTTASTTPTTPTTASTTTTPTTATTTASTTTTPTTATTTPTTASTTPTTASTATTTPTTASTTTTPTTATTTASTTTTPTTATTTPTTATTTPTTASTTTTTPTTASTRTTKSTTASTPTTLTTTPTSKPTSTTPTSKPTSTTPSTTFTTLTSTSETQTTLTTPSTKTKTTVTSSKPATASTSTTRPNKSTRQSTPESRISPTTRTSLSQSSTSQQPSMNPPHRTGTPSPSSINLQVSDSTLASSTASLSKFGHTDSLHQDTSGGSSDSTTVVAAGAAGGCALLLLLLILAIFVRRKRGQKPKGRTLPMDDNLSYHSLETGLEFDNVGYDNFMKTHMDRQKSECDSGVGDVEAANNIMPRIAESGASTV